MYDKCHALTVLDLQWTARYCFWCPWKDQPNIFQPLYSSFIHSRYIVFIHITVLQKSCKTDKSPGLYTKPDKFVRFYVRRYCHTPFQDHRLFVLLLVCTTKCIWQTARRTWKLPICTITHPSIAHVLTNGEHPCWTDRQFLNSDHLETKYFPSVYQLLSLLPKWTWKLFAACCLLFCAKLA